MDVEKYNIFRVTTAAIFNNWNGLIFNKDEMLHCVEDLGTLWLAKPVGSSNTPRMLPKSNCRQLTELEISLQEERTNA